MQQRVVFIPIVLLIIFLSLLPTAVHILREHILAKTTGDNLGALTAYLSRNYRINFKLKRSNKFVAQKLGKFTRNVGWIKLL